MNERFEQTHLVMTAEEAAPMRNEGQYKARFVRGLSYKAGSTSFIVQPPVPDYRDQRTLPVCCQFLERPP